MTIRQNPGEKHSKRDLQTGFPLAKTSKPEQSFVQWQNRKTNSIQSVWTDHKVGLLLNVTLQYRVMNAQ